MKYIVNVTNAAIKKYPGFWVVEDEAGELVALVKMDTDKEKYKTCLGHLNKIAAVPEMCNALEVFIERTEPGNIKRDKMLVGCYNTARLDESIILAVEALKKAGVYGGGK